MQDIPKPFKRPPKRFQPPGLEIIYEDHDILVVDKRSGLLTVSTDRVKDNTAFFLLNAYVKKGNQKSRNRVFIVHRLDRDTSGVLVFAKQEKARDDLQAEWQRFDKKYQAVIYGTLPDREGMISSYLAENRAHKMYSVNDASKGKLARTGYRVLQQAKHACLVEIDLLTGRKNQIRVHFSEQGFPVVGDRKYGTKEPGVKRLMLHACSVTIRHPRTKERMTFEAKVPPSFKAFLRE